MNKLAIQVRDYRGESHYTSEAVGPFPVVKRRVYAQQIGNFNPLFCRYAGKTHLVHSDAGDVSDPFRRDASYAASFFIDVSSPCKWNL